MHDFKYSSWCSGWKASWAFWTLNIYCCNKLVRCYWFKIDILGNVGFANTEQLRNTCNPTRPRNNGKELALDLIPVIDSHLESISGIVFAKYFFLKNIDIWLTHFMPLISFDAPWKHQDVFSGYQTRLVAWNGLIKELSLSFAFTIERI